MLLNEIFDTPYEWKWSTKTPTLVNAHFRDKSGVQYEVQFMYKTESGTPHWEWEFSRIHNSQIRPGKLGAVINTMSKLWNPPTHQYGTTKTGDSHNIFSTIATIARQFVHDYQPDILSSLIEDTDRTNLYKRLMKIIMPGGRLELGDRSLSMYKA